VAQPHLRHPWFANFISTMSAATGVGYLAACYTVSRWLTKPTHRKIQSTPADHGLFSEGLTCDTEDRQRLAGWVVTPPRPRATVVLFHGVRHTREQTLSRTVFLGGAGFRCVAFDHRAHGESTGRRTSFGLHERHDVAAILELVRRRWPDQPCAALGLSMGAAALCYAAEHTRRLDAVILESLYHDIGSAFANRINSTYPPSFHRLSRGVFWMTERRLGVRVEQFAPVNRIASLAPVPVLLLTGEDDRHATAHDARRLYDRCGEPRELWLAPRAGHTDVCEAGGLLYRERILGFLERHLFPSDSSTRSLPADDSLAARAWRVPA
jgi:alpha-beta hydrolase superfamily lysophospholipase